MTTEATIARLLDLSAIMTVDERAALARQLRDLADAIEPRNVWLKFDTVSKTFVPFYRTPGTGKAPENDLRGP